MPRRLLHLYCLRGAHPDRADDVANSDVPIRCIHGPNISRTTILARSSLWLQCPDLPSRNPCFSNIGEATVVPQVQPQPHCPPTLHDPSCTLSPSSGRRSIPFSNGLASWSLFSNRGKGQAHRTQDTGGHVLKRWRILAAHTTPGGSAIVVGVRMRWVS